MKKIETQTRERIKKNEEQKRKEWMKKHKQLQSELDSFLQERVASISTPYSTARNELNTKRKTQDLEIRINEQPYMERDGESVRGRSPF